MQKEETALFRLNEQNFNFPLMEGTEGEKAVDIRSLRGQSGYIAYDDGYRNTGSCSGKITFIDGEKGILRYRGYPIEQLAIKSSFLETAYLIIYGELPNAEQIQSFRNIISENASVHEGMHRFIEGFPVESHPMAMLSAMVNSLGCYYPEMASNNRQQDLEYFDVAAAHVISKARTLAAMSYRRKIGRPFIHPNTDLSYTGNFLHLMFSEPNKEYLVSDEVVSALNLIFLLHADHEQNCSTSTVRMVGSGGANLFASISAGINALWGPLHGGANMAVIKMLEQIRNDGDDGSRFVEEAKAGKKIAGFGHAVYKNYDPRAKILGDAAEGVMKSLGIQDPLLDIARHLEKAALSDDYFIKRKLYPNVDFYSGFILSAIRIPLDFFTVIFAIGRMPGWIANWKEMAEEPKASIYRPRQIYVGPTERDYVPIEERA